MARHGLRCEPAPTDDELAAITAAIEVCWPRSVTVAESAVRLNAWRFSGRWWSKPVAARRDRPWY